MRITTALIVFFIASTAGAEDPAGKLHLSNGDRVVMTYNADYIESPDADQPYYGRSGFIHPVYTPSGRIVTEGFPADHLHQHGLMFAWTRTSVEGRKVDFWNSKKQAGLIEHVETKSADDRGIVVRLRHVDRTASKPTTVLEEGWNLKIVPHDSMNVFDLESVQMCVIDTPLSINEYHYGAMCIRGPSAWLEDATMLTSEGIGRPDGNHTRPNWVALSGKVDGHTCGIAAIGHPGNFRAPQPVRLHPNKPYFCFAPMVLGSFQIEPSKPYRSRFRFAAFDGMPNADQLNELWRDFAAN